MTTFTQHSPEAFFLHSFCWKAERGLRGRREECRMVKGKVNDKVHRNQLVFSDLCGLKAVRAMVWNPVGGGR